MAKKFSFRGSVPGLPGSVQQVDRARHIGLQERGGPGNGPVYMRFGSKVDHPVKAITPEYLKHIIGIQNVPLQKSIVGMVLDILKVFQVAGIGKGIEVINTIPGIFPDKMPD
jgi:hypothetical protein